MNPRESMKEVLKLAFEWLEEDIYGGLEFTQKEVENAIEAMHDNDTFFEEFMNFFKDHIEMFGENYGLTIEDED
jgi:hypothetical protein